MLFFYFILLCPLTYTHQHPPRTFRNEKVTCVINILKIEMVIDRKGRHTREFGIPAGCRAPRTWPCGLALDLGGSPSGRQPGEHRGFSAADTVT